MRMAVTVSYTQFMPFPVSDCEEVRRRGIENKMCRRLLRLANGAAGGNK